MRPVVMLENGQEQEEERIRSLIKSKILARELFRKMSKQKGENEWKGLNKIQSEKRGMKKILILHPRHREHLPHLV